MALRYLTIDFNSFFASVEQQERPELRGKPVAIVPVLAETTGAIAVSIEAKKRRPHRSQQRYGRDRVSRDGTPDPLVELQ